MTLFEPDAGAPLPDHTRRLRLVVAYNGSAFHGFAINFGVRTVAGELSVALQRWLGHEAILTCAGRTDRGVHARGQVVTLDVDADKVGTPTALSKLTKALNKMCGPQIAVRELALVEDGFDARFSATSRRYRYRIWNRPEPNPFSAGWAWHVPAPMSMPHLRLACDPLIGEHDFSTFCKKPKMSDGSEPNMVRRITEALWVDEGDGHLRLDIEAAAFCHHMVRSIVGTLVLVGLGKWTAGEMRSILEAKDRARCGDMAPPEGLTLWTVRYPNWSS